MFPKSSVELRSTTSRSRKQALLKPQVRKCSALTCRRFGSSNRENLSKLNLRNNPLHIYQATSGQAFGYPGVELTKSHGLEFIRWVVLEAWCDSPGNTGEPKNKPNIDALQNACPEFISRPQAQSSYKLVSYRMVGLEICQTCTYPTVPLSPGSTPILFPSP